MSSNPKTTLPKKALPYDLGYTLNHAKRVMGPVLLPEVEDQIRKIYRHTQRQLRRYGFAAKNHHRRTMRSREFILTTSFGYRIISVLHGYPKGKPFITFDEVKKLADQASPRHAPKEPVFLTQVTKSGGGKRSLAVFGPVARANQHLARDMVLIARGISRFEFARKGRGREAMMDRILNAVKKGGVRALGTLDVKDCFPSIASSAVEMAVPLSRRVIENSLYVKAGTPIDKHKNAEDISESAVHIGLPQGALTSPLVAGLVLEPCLDKVAAILRCAYVDDVPLGDASKEKVQAQLDTLTAALKSQYPNSPLFTKHSTSFKIGKHADILGYWVRPNAKKYGGGIRFSPSNTALRRFYVKLSVRLLQEPFEKWDQIAESMAYAFADAQGHWGGKLGGREFMITAFFSSIAPLLSNIEKKISDAKKSGMSGKHLTLLIETEAPMLLPKIVLVNQNGLVKWTEQENPSLTK